jgi:hypothetical protein
MDEDVAFARDIRPLFSNRDVSSMSRYFDLSSYDDVRANAERIYRRLADGTMRGDAVDIDANAPVITRDEIRIDAPQRSSGTSRPTSRHGPNGSPRSILPSSTAP